MSDQNGRSPTAITIAGIVFDMNRITRKEYYHLNRQINELRGNDPERVLSEEDSNRIQELSGQLYAKIIVSWPFSEPATTEGYCDLGMMDSALVDDAFEEMVGQLKEKKLERLSGLLPNTKSPSTLPNLSPNLEQQPS
jgi:hypothetical protein